MGNGYGPGGSGTDHQPDGVFSSLVTGPVAPLLTTTEAKEHLRVDYDDEDALIDGYVAAAADMVDAQWGELGRAMVTQRWQLTLPAFPASGVIILPIPPVQAVTGITYYDADNAEQTLASDTYLLTINDSHARLDKAQGAVWPSTYARADAVAVRYDAGYGDLGTDVPEGIRQAVKLMVGHWYENRSAVSEAAMNEMPLAVRSLLHKYRVARGYI